MNEFLQGATVVFEWETLLCLGIGVILGMLVGAFPGVTATMSVALAAGFTLTLEPIQGLAVLITIYVAAQFGDRIPAILLNTPGTPASISTTFDGYPMAKRGEAGLAMTVSAIAAAIGLMVGIAILLFAAIPISHFAREFGPPELFALVVFGLTMVIGVSSGRVMKGIAAALFGLLLATIGRDPMTGVPRFTFGILELNSGVAFIAVIIGLFGVGEVIHQMLTAHKRTADKPIEQVGQWLPDWKTSKRLVKPIATGSATGAVIGLVPAVGGDIAGIIGWDAARRISKRKDEFGKGSVEGLAAGDTSSAATLGGSVTTTMALGVPGDSVMAVIIGSMVIWGIQPGPALFSQHPSIAYSIAVIMILGTLVTLVLSLFRMRGMVKLLALPPRYLWVIILVFCVVGTFSVSNSVFDVGVMLLFGVVGAFMIRFGFPPAPTVLGLILGPLAESNLRRTLVIGGWGEFLESPIAMVLLGISALALIAPIFLSLWRKRRPSNVVLAELTGSREHLEQPEPKAVAK